MRIMTSDGASTPLSIRYSTDILHHRLRRLNRARFRPMKAGEDWQDSIEREREAKLLEGELLEHERRAVHETARRAPTSPEEFVRWFEALGEVGPGEGDPLLPFLAEKGSREALSWVVAQELVGEGVTEEATSSLDALAERETAVEASGVHRRSSLPCALAIDVEPAREDAVWEAVARGNLMVALRTNGRYAFHSIGARAACELVAPRRDALLSRATARLSSNAPEAPAPPLPRRKLGAKTRTILKALVREDPARALSLAEGALMRLEANARCYRRYRRELHLPAQLTHAAA